MTAPTNFEIYSVYVGTITAAEQRRQQSSVLYLSMISAGVVFWGGVPTFDPIFVIGPITVISLIWFLTIAYFRALAEAKFAVIQHLEKEWPIQPFALEWNHFKKPKKASFLTVALTKLEMLLPAVIFSAAFVYCIVRIYLRFCA